MSDDCFRDDINRVEELTREVASEAFARHAAEHIARKQSEILDQALIAIDGAHSLDKVIEAILRANARELQADGLSFWRYEPVSDEIVLQMMLARDEFYTDEMLAKVGVPRWVHRSASPTWPALLRTRKPFPVYDVEADTRITHKAQILAQQVESMLVVPLLSNQKLIGWSSTFHRAWRKYSEDYTDLAKALAQQATFAVELIRLADSGRAAARTAAQQALSKPLTQQELEVLSLLTQGKSNQEIAGALFIETSTVKAHVTHILDKLGVTSRGQAVNKARELGLLK